MGVGQTLNHWAQWGPLRDEGKEKNHSKKPLRRCGYPGWEEEQEHPREMKHGRSIQQELSNKFLLTLNTTASDSP